MSRFTETEERQFEHDVTIAHLETAVSTAANGMMAVAHKAGFEQQVAKTFLVEVKHAGAPGDGYKVHAHAVYARIVAISDEGPVEAWPPVDEPNEGDMDGEREARGPEEKDYNAATDLF